MPSPKSLLGRLMPRTIFLKTMIIRQGSCPNVSQDAYVNVYAHVIEICLYQAMSKMNTENEIVCGADIRQDSRIVAISDVSICQKIKVIRSDLA